MAERLSRIRVSAIVIAAYDAIKISESLTMASALVSLFDTFSRCVQIAAADGPERPQQAGQERPTGQPIDAAANANSIDDPADHAGANRPGQGKEGKLGGKNPAQDAIRHLLACLGGERTAGCPDR